MDEELIDISCEHCKSSDVCRYKTEYLKVKEAIEKIDIHNSSNNGGTMIKNITNLDWIKCVTIQCKYFKI